MRYIGIRFIRFTLNPVSVVLLSKGNTFYSSNVACRMSKGTLSKLKNFRRNILDNSGVSKNFFEKPWLWSTLFLRKALTKDRHFNIEFLRVLYTEFSFIPNNIFQANQNNWKVQLLSNRSLWPWARYLAMQLWDDQWWKNGKLRKVVIDFLPLKGVI